MSQDVYNLALKNKKIWTIEMLQNLTSKGKLTVDEYVSLTNSSPEDLIPSLETIRDSKIAELSAVCEETIVTGVDVTTSMGVEHFSLEIVDQIEITNQYNKVVMGATEVLYHADGNGGNCRLFSAEEMTALANTALAHVTYHRTYFNELKALVNRSTTIEVVNGITYGQALPADLDAHLVSLVGKSSIN